MKLCHVREKAEMALVFSPVDDVLERLSQEVRRRERLIRIFPNTESAMRMLGALLMEQDEIWFTRRLYFNIEHYREWKEADKVASKDGEKENEGKVA